MFLSSVQGGPNVALDEGITLHGNIRGGHQKNGNYSAAIKSCLFTRFSLTDKTAQDQFWERLPATFEEYKQATVANGDRVRAVDHQGAVEEDTDHRDATFVRVSGIVPRVRSLFIPIPHSTRCSGTYTNTYRAGNPCSRPPSTLGNSARYWSRNYHLGSFRLSPSPRESFSPS